MPFKWRELARAERRSAARCPKREGRINYEEDKFGTWVLARAGTWEPGRTQSSVGSELEKALLRGSCAALAEVCLKFERGILEPPWLIGRLNHPSKHAYTMKAAGEGSRHNRPQLSPTLNRRGDQRFARAFIPGNYAL